MLGEREIHERGSMASLEGIHGEGGGAGYWKLLCVGVRWICGRGCLLVSSKSRP